MPKPMGLAWEDNGRLTLAAGAQVLRFENVLAPNERINHLFDACFVPRRVHVTGALDAHDIGVDADGRVIFVNTRFNCLATLSDRHSFAPVWRPPFIDALVDEDRCHLNGLAMHDGRPAHVTAVSRSNTIDGWRDRRADGGVVIDVETGAIVCDGLSKPRYKRFEGLALATRLAEADSAPWCGVQIVDLATGTCVDWFRIDGAVAELYDVEVIPGFATPMAVAPGSDEAASLITMEKTEANTPASPAADKEPADREAEGTEA
jgi:hypothetical protein